MKVIEHEGVPSKEHKEWKEKIEKNAVNGAGVNGVKLSCGDQIKAKRENIIEFRPFGIEGFVTEGTVLEIDFADSLGYVHCKVISGNAYIWEYGTKITIFRNTGVQLAPCKERGEIIGIKKLTEPSLNTKGGYTDGGYPYSLGSVDPQIWQIL